MPGKLFLLIIFIVSYTANAQFILENAFPNLSFIDPLDLQNSGDGTDRIFVAERAGRIKVFPNSSSVTSLKTYLDITDRVSAGGEMGLLGLAFHPDYENNGYFYVNYTTSNPRKTRISRFQVSSENPDSADKNSEIILLTFSQPFSNHNGGWIGFGPDDGFFYIGVGDGGPPENAQNIETILGNILRIDVDNQDTGLQYAIPPDNPFADSTGSVVKEIYAWGMRNPWRNSFDPVTGWLWSADVGLNAWEEIDIIENGKNYGWRCYEGNHSFDLSGCDYPEYIFPIWEYSHGEGCSITGGYVYRGPTVPELTGKYIYADFCTKTVWSLEYDGIAPPDNQTLLTAPGNVTSFGVDENNELYIVTFSPDKIYRFSPSTTGFNGLHIPFEYKLEQNYPNPFNPETVIKFQLPANSNVRLTVYNILGWEVATLIDGELAQGKYEVKFSAKGENAYTLTSGIYFYQLRAGSTISSGNNFILTKKMILLK